MSDPSYRPSAAAWTSASAPQSLGPAATIAARPMTGLERFLGGTPAGVALRLVVVSLIVGALLVWLDIRPGEIFAALERAFGRFWAMGFDAVREGGRYLLAGAVIVVPVWFVARLLAARR